MEMQLDLFEGVILTTKQQEQVAKFKEDRAKNAKKAELRNQEIVGTLVEAGFVEGVDFKNTFNVSLVTDDAVLGYRYDDSQFTANDVEFIQVKGGVSFLSKRFSKEDNVVNDTVIQYFEFEGGKFEVSSVTGNYRKIKASTLLTKLQEQRKQAQINMDHFNRENLNFANAIDNLREKFPTADIFKFEDYDRIARSYHTVKRIKAQFKNGSYVTFNVGLDGTYRIAKKYDAATVGLNSDQLMEFFTNQNK
ncbi:MAG: hypothetical protein HKN40_02110 [Winogradskyella sp.]|uniref:hypothetical protein n=1 Tax=Winogradskyella sp. TaxID=1883156 RepID=UPI0018413381|nr:hypothetical protein [Winogradskyella sp.]